MACFVANECSLAVGLPRNCMRTNMIGILLTVGIINYRKRRDGQRLPQTSFEVLKEVRVRVFERFRKK